MTLECSVCLETYDLLEHVPRILPCSGAHDVCSACVKELRPAGEAFACPQCRDIVPSGARINENRLLLQALRQRGLGAARRAARRPRRRGRHGDARLMIKSNLIRAAVGEALLALVLAV